MNKFNFFISYSSRDGSEIANLISKQLTEKGYSVFVDFESLFAGVDFTDAITTAISNCDYFVPIITEGYISSAWAKGELLYACEESKSRSKHILPIVITTEIPPAIELRIARFRWFTINQNLQVTDAIEKITQEIDSLASSQLKTEILYEKLSEYRKLKSYDKEADTLCELITLTRRSLTSTPTKSWCNSMLVLYESLSKCYYGNYDKEAVTLAKKILKEIMTTEKIWSGTEKTPPNRIFYTDIFFISFVLRMIYMDREIRSECADITTHGDCINPCPTAWYVEKQDPFVRAYYSELQYANTEDRAFVTETEKYIIEGNPNEFSPAYPYKKTYRPESTREDETLVSIAKFMQEGNKLFDVLHKQGVAGDFLKCLLTSYERLKSYCEIVGAKNVAAECVDRIVEIKTELDKNQNEGAENEKAEQGIKSLLGYTLKNTGNFDVFISFKNEDSDLAEKIYRYCHKYMKEPFWSKRSLPELSKSEYEDAIYSALRNSKHFIVVLSKLEYLNANWVKTEMSTFHRAITEGRKKDANFVFVVTDNVYKEIIESNKMCLDERYCGYQIIKMSEYEDTLIQYIS